MDETPQTPETKSPEQKLNELKSLLQKSDADLGNLTKTRDALKSEIEALSKTVDEIKKTSGEFGQGEAGLKSSREEFETYNHTKTQMVEAALGEKKEQVEAEIKKIHDRIEKKREEVGKLREAATKAAAEYEAAKEWLQQKQRAYDDLKDLRKHVRENLQKLKDFKTGIEKFDEQTKPASMYVLLLEFKKVLDGTNVPSQAAYEKDLNAASEALAAAKAEVAQKESAAEAAHAQLATEEEALKAVEKNRLEEILKEVDKLN